MQNKTAVEWLLEKVNGYSHGIGMPYPMNVRIDIPKDIIEKAKEIEKAELENCWRAAHQAGRFEGKGTAETNWQTFENYYKENYIE